MTDPAHLVFAAAAVLFVIAVCVAGYRLERGIEKRSRR